MAGWSTDHSTEKLTHESGAITNLIGGRCKIARAVDAGEVWVGISRKRQFMAETDKREDTHH